jgi:probable biosynthetic protein (TIGR04098 family)
MGTHTMHRSRFPMRLGMPHTQSSGLGEQALLACAGDLRWTDIGAVSGVPASQQRDSEGRSVYASFYFAEVTDFGERGLAMFAPDDEIEIVSSLSRYGRTMLDGEHRLYRAGQLPAELPDDLPAAPRVRLSNVFVCEGKGPDDLRITSPANARIEEIPASEIEPDSYAIIRAARRAGRFYEHPSDAAPLWEGARTVVYRINPDRDVNGVGLIYFANYVAFMDYAERVALEESGAYRATDLDGRATVRRRIGYYGNAQRHDTLEIDVEAFRPAARPQHLLLHHRIRRPSDGRLIAVSTVEKVLNPRR